MPAFHQFIIFINANIDNLPDCPNLYVFAKINVKMKIRFHIFCNNFKLVVLRHSVIFPQGSNIKVICFENSFLTLSFTICFISN